MHRGLFVTATDTNVGKTVVCAALLARYRAEAPLRYWKPIQTGSDDDSCEVARLAPRKGAPYKGGVTDEILNCGVRLPDPVSPHLAARRAGTRITVKAIVDTLHGIEPRTPNPESRTPLVRRSSESEGGNPESRPRWIIEGAGGVLVPINERETMADLMRALDLPVLIAARSTLGTINHTLMTIEALRRRMLRVAGVVMIGDPNDENRLAIEKYGAAEVIAQMPWFDPLTPETLQQWATTEFDRGGVLFVGALR
jgi:dethiobiotin synthetase